MKMLYLDESGDHNLKRINPVYPIFVLGGIIVDRGYVRDVIEPRIRDFKIKYFGRDDVVLHTVEMGKARGSYGFLLDPVVRTIFYSELNALIDSFDFQVVACVVRKDQYVAQFGVRARDPYMYSLGVLVDRYCLELGSELDSGFICAEKRNPGLDRELLDAWQRLISDGGGTDTMNSREIDSRIVALDLKDKKPNLAGLQLADIVITPVGRHIAGHPPKKYEVQWAVVRKKLLGIDRPDDQQGLIVRP